MSPPIQPLPANLINLIAAGEVIDSFAAVVRELVENSLDAGATRLVISLCPESWQVKVADNGRGMNQQDLQNCGKPHSTSKIRNIDDLWKITSLGFRGEALHSITQVAELTIMSRCREEDSLGWCLHYNCKGEATQVETAPIAPGTIVTVSQLFRNIPLRRQGLPALSQQLKAVQGIIENLALCHPHITWQVQHQHKSWFNISPGKTAQQILPQLLKGVHFHDLRHLSQTVNITSEETGLIEVVLGLPDRCHRGRADWVKVGVNGRIVRSPQLEQTILAAFSRTLPKNRFPVCFIHLKIPPNQIDWNRHPAKTEIYLRSIEIWQAAITQIIEKIFRLSPNSLTSLAPNQRVNQLLKVSEEKGSYQIQSSGTTALDLMQLRVVGQVNQTYIVAEHAQGLWLIEQHIAHERILYEKLQDKWQLITLETPIILTQLSPSQVEQLQKICLEIEEFGEKMWAVRTVPQLLSQRDDCPEALVELSLGKDLESAQVATACRSAIRNGTPMSLVQMQELVDDWKMTRNPRTCPHGRPIYLSLDESSLSRFFRRHWVIGKSHGI